MATAKAFRLSSVPPTLVAYRRILTRFIHERRRLRTRHLLYLGEGRMLAGFDMGYKLPLALNRPKTLLAALHPSPSDLAILAICLLVLGNLLEPISILVGDEHHMHAMNLLTLNDRGCVHVIDPRSKSHAELLEVRALNEGSFAELFTYPLALGAEKRRAARRYLAGEFPLLNGLDGAAYPTKSARREKAQRILTPRKPLEQLLGEDTILQANLLVIDSSRHFFEILEGLTHFWRLNPYGHVVARIDPRHFDAEQWERFSAVLARSYRRAWILPKAQLARALPTQPRALWITPSML